MRAEILKIEEDSVKVVTEDDEVKVVPKNDIDFEYKVGDKIRIVKDDEKDLFLPFNNQENSEKKNRGSHAIKFATIIFACVVVVVSIATTIIAPRIIEEEQKNSLNSQLNACLFDGYKKLYPKSLYTSNEIETIKQSIFTAPKTGDVRIIIGDRLIEEEQKDEYDMALSCYNNYQVEGYQEIIDELLSYENIANQQICVYNSEKNSEITEAEIESAKTNILESIAIMTRWSNRYQEQINCYEKFKTEESDSKISELKDRKSKNDAYLESAKKMANSSRISTHCAVNTIGNYTYINCY